MNKKMKLIHLFFILLSVIAISGCSSSNIAYDYDHSYVFNNYKSFEWSNDKELIRNDNLNKYPVLVKNIKNVIGKALKDKNIILQENGKSDFIIYIHSGQQKDVQLKFYPWWLPCGTTTVSGYDENTLVIDIANKNKTLIWRGLVYGFLKSPANSETPSEQLNSTISLLIENFPPG